MEQEANPKIRFGLLILQKNVAALKAFLDWLKDFHNKNRAKLLVFDNYPIFKQEEGNEKSPFEKTLTLLGNIWNKERTHQLESDELILDTSIQDLTDSIFASADIATELYIKLLNDRKRLGKLEGKYQTMRSSHENNGSSENLQVIDQYHAVETAEGNAEVAESDFLLAIDKFERLLNEEFNNYLLNYIKDKTAHYVAFIPEINQTVMGTNRSSLKTTSRADITGSPLFAKSMKGPRLQTSRRFSFICDGNEEKLPAKKQPMLLVPNNASTNLDVRASPRRSTLSLKKRLEIKRKQLVEAKEAKQRALGQSEPCSEE